ncbi:voltage-dependent anion channel-domain-containing protein [Cristinia sonorae]|uniref:Voltage-dependent anion channel-domain-containing protein n=1 Tax=Cristinia sonorae TaxID=1940300 RepID=A0A8K0UXR0_9AGAR|nr:voltage-dependent anion channel-domain-containing protein [Cristinia sonorae]
MSQDTLNNPPAATKTMGFDGFAGLPGRMSVHVARVNRLSRLIHGWSWQAYPIGMGTAAVYVCLAGVDPTPSHGLHVVQTIFYFLNIGLFLLNTTTLLLQLLLYPRQAVRLVLDPGKGIFVPLIVLSFATIIIGTVNYTAGGDVNLSPTVIYALFWVYIGFALVVCFPMLMIWFNHPHDLTTFTPAWAFLVFPMMLGGVVASNVLRVLDPADVRALGVLMTGYVFQGLGFFMTLFYVCIYIIRIMTTGFLEGHQASGAFVACGPPGFTALALMNLGESARSILTAQNLVSPMAGEIWYATSVLSALLLFGLAVFFFAFGVLPYWFKLHKRLSEILGCWALTFPNVGWILATRKIGDIFNLESFRIWNLIMTILMCLTWLVLFYFTGLALLRGKIFTASPEETLRDSRLKRPDLEMALAASTQVGLGVVSVMNSEGVRETQVINASSTVTTVHVAEPSTKTQ